MRASKYLAFVFALILCAGGCARQDVNSLTQISTIDALLAGTYDGDVTLGDLAKCGDFGIGTFDALDGEMVLLDGVFYQVVSDGSVKRPSLASKTPFASVIPFKPDTYRTVNGEKDFPAICKMLDEMLPNKNIFCAIKIDGQFEYMKTRSVPAQKKPYPPLAQVTKYQPVFEMEKVSGTIVGFRCPAFVKGVNVPGYHLHFLNDMRDRGGHILAFRMKRGNISACTARRFVMRLPGEGTGFSAADLAKDRSKELHQVEK